MYPRYAAHELEEGDDSDSSDSEDEEDKPTSLGQFFTEGMEELLEDKGKELRDKVEPFLDYLHRYYQGMVSHALKNLQILQKKVAVPIFVCCMHKLFPNILPTDFISRNEGWGLERVGVKNCLREKGRTIFIGRRTMLLVCFRPSEYKN